MGMIHPDKITKQEREVMNGLWREFLAAGTVLEISLDRTNIIRSAAFQAEIPAARLTDHMNGVTGMVLAMPQKQQQAHLAYLAKELG